MNVNLLTAIKFLKSKILINTNWKQVSSQIYLELSFKLLQTLPTFSTSAGFFHDWCWPRVCVLGKLQWKLFNYLWHVSQGKMHRLADVIKLATFSLYNCNASKLWSRKLTFDMVASVLDIFLLSSSWTWPKNGQIIRTWNIEDCTVMSYFIEFIYWCAYKII